MSKVLPTILGNIDSHVFETAKVASDPDVRYSDSIMSLTQMVTVESNAQLKTAIFDALDFLEANPSETVHRFNKGNCLFVVRPSKPKASKLDDVNAQREAKALARLGISASANGSSNDNPF